ncbi:MAG: SdrD B-like domain-containing protein [Chitinophagaceae bacterium]|jgi:hypothetical protein
MKKNNILFKSLLFTLALLLNTKTAISQNLLTDGNFSTTTSITPLGGSPIIPNIWYSWKSEGTVSAFSAEVSGGVCSFSFINTGYNWWDVQLNQYGFSLTKGDAYRLRFDVRSDANRYFGIYIGQEGDPWTNLNTYNYYQYATTSWETKTITFIAASVFPLHKLSFELGGSNSKIYFDNIVLEKVIPSKVVLPGTFQTKLGCSYDWNADGSCTQLVKNNSNGKWEGSFMIPAGCYEYKVALDGSWELNYGLNGIFNGPNIQLEVPTASLVTFIYDPETHIVVSSPYSGTPITGVSLVGEFQSELDCSFDWDYGDCNKPELAFNSTSGLWEGTFNLAAGCYKYVAKVLNNCGFQIYGKDGINWGNQYSNFYLLYLPSQTDVTITYNPVTRQVNSTFNTDFCPPNTVVLPGTFQSELGCKPVTYINGDWEPGCDFTRLTYDPTSKLWIGTFDIPAGYWEYKIAYNNNWNENYGLNGVQGGPNIPLDLCVPTRITFKYNHTTHLVQLVTESSTICINKFYDANVNGIQDYNEPPLQGVTFTLGGDATKTGTTDASGKITFTGLVPGNYTVTETMPSGYYATTATAKNISLELQMKMDFGNVCLGPGGAKGIGYWMSKNGKETMLDNGTMEPELYSLRLIYLSNADGSDFNPMTYEQLQNWLKNANATNMAYMLSAQLAAMYLNYEAGFVKWDSYLYTPGCGSLGEGNFNSFYGLYYTAIYNLWWYNYTPAGHLQRSYQECLKNALDNANNNLSFVQPQPCSVQTPVTRRENIVSESTNETAGNMKVWPNPSGSYFNLQPSFSNEAIQLRVFDVNGRLVYTANGASNKVYRFGDNLKPGIYLVEVLQGKNRTVQKLLKH